MTSTSVPCSGCARTVVLDLDNGVARVQMPSNGKRGSLHVPAHALMTDEVVVDETLAMWDCPACGYADSLDLTDEDA